MIRLYLKNKIKKRTENRKQTQKNFSLLFLLCLSESDSYVSDFIHFFSFSSFCGIHRTQHRLPVLL